MISALFLIISSMISSPFRGFPVFWPITRQQILDKFKQILDSSKLKEFADDNFKFDENGSKLSKQVENTVEKGEIARYEQFLLFPQCFQNACFPGASEGVIVWEWVEPKLNIKNGLSTCKYITLSQTTNFRHFQTEKVCRQQFQIWRKRQ